MQQLHADLKDKRMIVSKDQIHLSSVVGHGKQPTAMNFCCNQYKQAICYGIVNPGSEVVWEYAPSHLIYFSGSKIYIILLNIMYSM